MESCCLDRYTPLETALKEAGFIVDEIGREGKKTVITVIRGGDLGEKPVFPNLMSKIGRQNR
jgi:hypothetical protein